MIKGRDLWRTEFEKLAAMEGVMPTFMERIRQAGTASAARDAEPVREDVNATVPDRLCFLERVRQAEAASGARCADPFREEVAAIMRGKDAIGTAPLLDLLGLPKTTGNARRIGNTMRSLGFVPIKSRRLLPGGYRDTVTRGWTRPVREDSKDSGLNKVTGDKVGSPLSNA
jgi:hypothetical protein